MSTRKRDPWVDVKTYHGLPADQVISALHKEIRRGNTENAVLLAYEMMITSSAIKTGVERVGVSPMEPETRTSIFSALLWKVLFI